MKKIILLVAVLIGSLEAEAKKDRSLQVAFFGGLSLLNKTTTSTTLTNGMTTFPGEWESTYENTWSAGLEVRSIPMDDWMFKGGIRTMPERKVESALLRASGYGIQDLTILSPYSYRSDSVYFDVGYSWETFYIFLGFSFNTFDFKVPDPTAKVRGRGGSGSNFGIGFQLSEDFAIEYSGHAANVTIESGDYYEYKEKTLLQDAVLSFRYAFW